MRNTDKKASALQERPSLYYRFVRGILRRLFPPCRICYEEEPEDTPAVFVCNHAAICGPVMMTLNFPRRHKNWMIACATDEKQAAVYAYHDIFFGESRQWKGFWRLLSRIVACGLPPLLRGSDPIPVYHDRRVVQTFRQSLAALREGNDLVIFAEDAKRFSAYVNELQSGFVNLGRMVYKETGKLLRFYPVYLEKKNRIISVGRSIAFDPSSELYRQREAVARFLRNEIDRLARALPPHRPVPFLPQRWYDAYGEYEDNFPAYWQMIEEQTGEGI